MNITLIEYSGVAHLLSNKCCPCMLFVGACKRCSFFRAAKKPPIGGDIRADMSDEGLVAAATPSRCNVCLVYVSRNAA